MKVPFKIIKEVQTAPTPFYSTPASVGFDISAVEESIIQPYHWMGGKVHLVRTGIRCAFPEGFELQVRQRSGLSLEYPNYLANGIGTIDADYRGEVFIPIVNWTKKTWLILKGDRIAQGIVSPVVQVEVDDYTRFGKLPDTVRGSGGFGSTGR